MTDMIPESDRPPKNRRFLPTNLFGRAFLILVLPIVLVQLVAIYIFYERHWDSVLRNMSNAFAGEVDLLVTHYRRHPDQLSELKKFGNTMGIEVMIDTSRSSIFVEGEGKESYPEFFNHLKKRLHEPFMIQRVGVERDIRVSVLAEDAVLHFITTKKRLVSSTTYIFIMWIAGAGAIVMLIAVLFLRNQIKPIVSLAAAAEKFGMGQDIPGFRPRGASEVRQAGRAFMVMKDRIKRQIATRTEMLAGISHDLRTPLTRLKLQLAIAKLPEKDLRAMQGDIEEMEHMINEYLDFARGEGSEPTEEVRLAEYLKAIVENYRRQDQAVEIIGEADAVILIRPKAMRRCLQNIIDNAIRYGRRAELSVRENKKGIDIIVDDYGEGIPEEYNEEVFRPFKRLDPSRNTDTGGAGLGLSVARDVVLAHGGRIELINRGENKIEGLRVVIHLPKQAEHYEPVL